MAGTPFKMKGSPMQRNFGIGGSPMRKGEIKKYLKKVKSGHTVGASIYRGVKKVLTETTLRKFDVHSPGGRSLLAKQIVKKFKEGYN